MRRERENKMDVETRAQVGGWQVHFELFTLEE